MTRVRAFENSNASDARSSAGASKCRLPQHIHSNEPPPRTNGWRRDTCSARSFCRYAAVRELARDACAGRPTSSNTSSIVRHRPEENALRRGAQERGWFDVSEVVFAGGSPAMADAKSLNDLFVENLRRAYETEKRLAKALPKLHEAATFEELRHALQTHFEETELDVDRLEQVFEWLDETPKSQTCEAIKGILDDGKHVRDLDAEPDVKDAALIAAVQEAEHFEIALYGTLRTWAALLGKTA